ncbi:MAG TPA: hypothetical protein VHM70_17070 [Polyangiaceae bacterium]|jgi:hypothetical protein|nr:hypothetical protein [Polyangiaceae bacterium]
MKPNEVSNAQSTVNPNLAAQEPATPPADVESNPNLFHLAFKRVEAEIKAVPTEQLVPINFDPRGVVATILGAYPEIIALRSQLNTLPFDISIVDKLKDYALALGHAHARCMQAVEAGSELAELGSEGSAIRDRLQADAQGLAKRGIMNPKLLDKFRNGNGYKNIAFDVVGLAEAFLDVWDKLGGKTLVTREELEHAREVGNRLIEQLGLREQGPAEKDQASIVRQQAYVLCAHAYDEVRQAVAYIRRHEQDAEQIAPSLFAGRGGRPAVEPETPEVNPATGATGSTSSSGSNPTTGAPVTPSTTTPAAGSSVAAGLPGSPAFIRP